jgi:hypothetical protein
MTQPNNRLTREQWIALLKDCASSGLSIRQYAALKNVGYSTLTKWAALTGISLKRNPRQAFSQFEIPSVEENSVLKDHECLNTQNNEAFSFIEVTSYVNKGEPTQNVAPTTPCRTLKEPVSSPPLDLPSCGLEICMPNGVILKVDQVPFPALWPQIMELVCAVAP